MSEREERETQREIREEKEREGAIGSLMNSEINIFDTHPSPYDTLLMHEFRERSRELEENCLVGK